MNARALADEALGDKPTFGSVTRAILAFEAQTEGERANPGWAYRTANGTLLRGPCHDSECRYVSEPGGDPHAGKHSWQDGTTGYAHDYGQPCECEGCQWPDYDAKVDA